MGRARGLTAAGASTGGRLMRYTLLLVAAMTMATAPASAGKPAIVHKATADRGGQRSPPKSAARPDSSAAGKTMLVATTTDDLQPTWEKPWNPPGPVPRRRMWERAVLLPGRIVSLPLSGLGFLTDQALRTAEAKDWINPNRVNEWPHPRDDQFGYGLARAGILGDHSGPSAGLRLHAPVFQGRERIHLSALIAGSTNKYFGTTVAATGDRAQLTYAYDWLPRELFFGMGGASRPAGISDYSVQSHTLQGDLHWGAMMDPDSLKPRSRLDVWAGPREVATGVGHDPARPNFTLLYPDLAATVLDRRTEHLVYGASWGHDLLFGRPHWEHGWRAYLSAERYDRAPGWLELGGGAQGAQFNKYVMEGETGISFMRNPRTLRLLVRMVNEDVGSGGEHMLISDLASLGGHEGLGGYEPGRFSDHDSFLARVSYIFPIVYHAELDLHSEWGNVYPDVWHDLKPSTFHNSYGIYLRGRMATRAWGSVGFDISPDQTRFRYILGAVP